METYITVTQDHGKAEGMLVNSYRNESKHLNKRYAAMHALPGWLERWPPNSHIMNAPDCVIHGSPHPNIQIS